MSVNVFHLDGTEYQRNRAFSPAVVTEGGKVIWLAGQTTTVDESGNGWRQLPWHRDDNYLGGLTPGAGPVREVGLS